jgi:protein-tyrosine-phosphatase
MHRRLHEIPWTGGASSLRESIHDPLLKKYTQTLLQTIGYEGVAMVEFRRGYLDSIPYFLEINGRLWGSIALCLHAGIDIPAALIDCVLTGTVCPERRQHSYSDGLRCRNVYPGEVRYLRSIFRATAQTNFPSPPSFASSLFEFFLLFLHPLVRYDVFWFRDPRPAFWQAVVAFADLRAGLLYNARKFFRKYINARSASPKWQKLPALTKPPRALLFVCFGNICRSPFAEKAWNAFAEKNGSSIRATSAGLYPHSGRISPPALAPLIRSLGFDLTSHRSQEITSAMIETADVICVMDMENWHSLLHSFPHAKMKTILLGAFSGDSDPQIPDPFAMPAHRARAVYEKILRSVDGLFTALRSLA